MPTNIYWIHKFDNSAKIGIMARPRGGDWLEDEINHLKNNEVGVLGPCNVSFQAMCVGQGRC